MKGILVCIIIGAFILFIALTLEALKPITVPIIVIGSIVGMIYLGVTQNKGKD
ncbi:hypothetical protein [Pedobacter borealis]|uniref:hypothetical protein n=1 Tax=Pedobacter borealis TaxID=475254 RepID=UPI0012F98245|nr:hypothetical protein [Pedobacter borealis]